MFDAFSMELRLAPVALPKMGRVEGSDGAFRLVRPQPE